MRLAGLEPAPLTGLHFECSVAAITPQARRLGSYFDPPGFSIGVRNLLGLPSIIFLQADLKFLEDRVQRLATVEYTGHWNSLSVFVEGLDGKFIGALAPGSSIQAEHVNPSTLSCE